MVDDVVGGLMIGAFMGWFVGMVFGDLRSIRQSADAAVSDRLPDWWKTALFKARQRKELKQFQDSSCPNK